MNDSAIRSCLRRLKASSDPDTVAIANGLSDYLDLRDPATVRAMPDSGTQEAAEPAILAVRSPDDPDGQGILEAIALLIDEDRYQGPLVNHPRWNCFGYQAFSYGQQDQPAKRRLHEILMECARRVDVSDETLVRYALLEHPDSFTFGWVRIEDGRPSAWRCDPRLFDLRPPATADFSQPFERLTWELADDVLAELILAEKPPRSGAAHECAHVPGCLLGSLAAFRPTVLAKWMERSSEPEHFRLDAWQCILRATDRFDDIARNLAPHLPLQHRIGLLSVLSDLRPEAHLPAAREAALICDPESLPAAVAFLADRFPKDLPNVLTRAISQGESGGTANMPDFILEKAFRSAATIWEMNGRAVFEAVPAAKYVRIGSFSPMGTRSLYSYGLHGLLTAQPRPPVSEIRTWTERATDALDTADVDGNERKALRYAFWAEAVERAPALFVEDLLGLLQDPLKTFRQLAISGLIKTGDENVPVRAAEMLTTGKLNARLGAAAFLAALGTPNCKSTLEAALESEAHEKVRAAILEGLEALGAAKASPPDSPQNNEIPFSELEKDIQRQLKRLKSVAPSWLDWAEVPPLLRTNGDPLSTDAIRFLLARQALHKAIQPAPDLLPLIAHVDRDRSAPFAAALVEGFLQSEQAAADRWALTLGGILGDDRIIPLLLARIQGWCDNSRHKLAEYAAQAIALLPGDPPLMVLDTLANRYRSKYKNVGKACAEAFRSAAEARGITPDELGDMVVPTFDFDSDGIRRFDWEGGGACAELGPDLKLSWFDPETDKTWKSLPAAAPDSVKTEVKTLGKLLREAVKGQTPRLEMALVRQRRWPVIRWRELYENHPLLRAFASNLVWGVYDESGGLLRTFRRYPNGLLANAAGELEELSAEDTRIGMVHPLDLEAAAIDAWRAHLARFKVKQPFPQIDRPVERLDPLHGNRREISMTNEKPVGAGTFRSRAEKRGWARGSVVDGGGISSYYKTYPGAGVEVILPTEGFWVGIDPMDTIKLGSAYFVSADSVNRGSCTYDEPLPGDPRVLRFDALPPVVWSETVSDLKAILGM